MIVREIVNDPYLELARFDFFNDYADTRAWLLRKGRSDIVSQLDSAHTVWLRRRQGDEPPHPENTDLSVAIDDGLLAVFRRERPTLMLAVRALIRLGRSDDEILGSVRQHLEDRPEFENFLRGAMIGLRRELATSCYSCGQVGATHVIAEMSPRAGKLLCDRCLEIERKANRSMRDLSS